ncbi:MAG: DUF1501 domain-containing protein [Pseudomonadota bacterium]
MKHERKKLSWHEPAESILDIKRRSFLGRTAGLCGMAFMAQMGAPSKTLAAGSTKIDFSRSASSPLAPLAAQFTPRARRVIFLHMAGAPSQLELFDYKPELIKYDGKDTPASFMEGKTFAFLSGIPKLLGSRFPFKQHGECGAYISDRLPNIAQHVDDICFIKSLYTDQFNHAPAQLKMHTGNAQLGHASFGSWATYGLGSENQNLPGYIVLTSGGPNPSAGKALWGPGYLPSVYQGVQCRSEGEPVLFLDNPKAVNKQSRRNVLDALNSLNELSYERYADPETVTRIAQYEMAFRMQTEATEAFDLADESEIVRDRYGVREGEGGFANNCLLARRLAERGVRFIQLFDWGWDSHGDTDKTSLDIGFANKCREIDQPIGALLSDLKASGLLEDTLVVFASEFGRTPMQETGKGGEEWLGVGRDHNPAGYTVWMAGGGVKGGYTHGATDELGYEAAEMPVSVHDFHATLLYLLGFEHSTLNYPFQGLEQRLTGVHHCAVVPEVLA